MNENVFPEGIPTMVPSRSSGLQVWFSNLFQILLLRILTTVASRYGVKGVSNSFVQRVRYIHRQKFRHAFANTLFFIRMIQRSFAISRSVGNTRVYAKRCCLYARSRTRFIVVESKKVSRFASIGHTLKTFPRFDATWSNLTSSACSNVSAECSVCFVRPPSRQSWVEYLTSDRRVATRKLDRSFSRFCVRFHVLFPP